MAGAAGLLISAPSSGCGKTLVSLALMRLLARQGLDPRPAKSGPDYIDPAFHAIACGRSSLNLDAYAMRPGLIEDLADAPGGPLIVEGAMGLFDGAADGTGSAASLACQLGLPVVLVVDCARQAQSVAALVAGFARWDPAITIGGLILNRVGSARHADMLARALDLVGIRILAALPHLAELELPSRHLGLVQAMEHADMDGFAERAADWLEDRLDLAACLSLAGTARGPRAPVQGTARPLAPLGQRIALAQDAAFAFAYPHLINGWQAAGAQIIPFSPLADAPPDADADAVYLPGGYPELHAGRLAANRRFRVGMEAAAARGCRIYGECGGYMMLGTGLVDAAGQRHAMLGLLPLETSFAARRRHLGYRKARRQGDALPWGPCVMAHEFHYASILSEGADGTPPLFAAQDAQGQDLGPMGLQRGRIAGSFLHVIDEARA